MLSEEEKISILLAVKNFFACCQRLIYINISYEMMKDGDRPKGTVVHRGKKKFFTPVLPDFY